MAATSSNSPKPNPPWKYHVFLSFRGEDTRYNFTDHLYAALWRKGIITFRDNEELERGEVIKHELLQAIEESLFSIVILSQNYASSSWCLDELQKILESRKALGREVFPIFYGIDPSNVRHQLGCFAEAFKKHEERFSEDRKKVEGWRDALSEVASLSGFDSKNQHETELIEQIIEVLWRRLGPNLPSHETHELVGIDKRLRDMYEILEMGSLEVRFVGVWGMAGIGKTTLANLVYNQFCDHFDISCCLENVREKSCGVDGLLGLQMKLLSKLAIRNMEIDNLDQGKARIRSLLSQKKVLLLLDDVDHRRQLEHLAGKQDWFGPGSRIIVTTRDMHPLKSHEVQFEGYKVELLNNLESFELFCRKAFKRNQHVRDYLKNFESEVGYVGGLPLALESLASHRCGSHVSVQEDESLGLSGHGASKKGRPIRDYLEFLENMVGYARGLPLALKVLGSHICGRDESMWEDAFNKIRKSPPKDIMDTLRISYDGLDNDEMTMFLDIACFFKGWNKDQVTQILENCGFNAIIGIEVLLERSLLACQYGVLQMHDLLQEMGRNIVIQNSCNEIGKQSRLWCLRDIDQVLRKNKGTEFIQGIVLGSHDHEKRSHPKGVLLESRNYEASWDPEYEASWDPEAFSKILLKSRNYEASWDPQAFSKMCNLRVLIILHGLHLHFPLKCLSRSLKVLEWKQCPLQYLPLGVQLDELVDLRMHDSKIKHLWSGSQNFEMLKFIDLSYSKDLTRTANFSVVPNLESLVLEACTNLVEVHQSVGQLKKLVVLNLKDCINIKILPSKLEMNTLKDFILSGCSKVGKLPEFGEIMEGLLVLDLRGCNNLVCLPKSICNLKSLRILNISGCSKFSELPENIGQNKALEELDLGETAISEVPSSVGRLENLKLLSFYGCGAPASNSWYTPSFFERMFRRLLVPKVFKLPIFSHCYKLGILDVSYCNLNDGSIPNNLDCLSSLAELKLCGNNFVNLPTQCVSNLSKLFLLDLSDCQNLQSLPMLPPHIDQVRASNCVPMEPLPFFKLWKPIVSQWPSNLDPHWLQLVITGSDIPPWFNRQNDFSFNTCPSITVDIHPCCWSNRWRAIALCVVFERQVDSCVRLASLKDLLCRVGTPGCSCVFPLRGNLPYETSENFNCPHQIIIFFMATAEFMQQHLRNDSNQLNLTFNVQIGTWEGISNDLKITKCGWRVVCDKDECKAASENSRVTEMVEVIKKKGEATASNGQANLEQLAKRRKLE